MTLEQIWETSRNNEYSFYTYYVNAIGIILLLIACAIKGTVARRTIKALIIITTTLMVYLMSSYEINRKWEIRFDWIQNNKDKITEEEARNATYRDGGNLVMGPMFSTINSITLQLITIATLFIIRIKIQKRAQQVNAPDRASRGR